MQGLGIVILDDRISGNFFLPLLLSSFTPSFVGNITVTKLDKIPDLCFIAEQEDGKYAGLMRKFCLGNNFHDILFYSENSLMTI